MSREQDAVVAEKVFGFEVSPPEKTWIWMEKYNGKASRVMQHYTSDPFADYQVLKHIRENWKHTKRYSYEMALQKIWHEREGSFDAKNYLKIMTLYYEPGDYSIAALKVLGHD